MGRCPFSAWVGSYVRSELSEDKQGQFDAHLDRCLECQQSIAADRAPKHHESASGDDGESDGIGHLPDLSSDSSNGDPSNARSEVVFGDYRIIKELPQGGQAHVYKAFHRPTKMTVALKVLPPGQCLSEAARHAFQREVELAASLNHPNIVAIRDTGIARGQFYFSMEYIRGQTLDEFIRSRSCSLREKMLLFEKICDAMTHAHQRGVIHRDIKPSNVLVDERGDPHILDFGLAKSAGGWLGASLSTVLPSVTGQLKGTLAYMSPEQAAGQTDQIDIRTDVYSLGLVLYQMVTGRFPYEVTGAPTTVLSTIQSVDPTPPSHVVSRLDSDVDAIIMKALEKQRALRYQSAAEFQHDVRCWLDGLPIVAKSTSSIYLLRKLAARHRHAFMVLLLLCLIVAGFSFVSVDLALSEHRARREAQGLTETLAQEVEARIQEGRLLTFAQFLQAWHRSDDSWGSLASGVLLVEGNSREKAAVQFLLDSRSAEQKEAGFRESLGPGERAFAEFVIGEHYYREGDGPKALAAFNRGASVMQRVGETAPSRAQVWLSRWIGVRRQELSGMPGGDAAQSSAEDRQP